jgi:hypothetical protein
MKIGFAALCLTILGTPSGTAFVPRSLSQQTVSGVSVVSLPSKHDSSFSMQMAVTETDKDSDASKKSTTPFENTGAFAWMKPYLQAMGFTQGKTLYGALPLPAGFLDKPSSPSSSTAASSSNQQYEINDLQNIGIDERARRDQVGDVMLAASVLYGTWASLWADHGGSMGHVLRGGLALPLFFAVGFKLSAKEGL